MKITIDEEEQVLTYEDESGRRQLPLYSDEAFEIVAQQYLMVGWNQRYTYTFSWLGRPIIQLPDDMFRIQEVIHSVKPDVIIETGIAHGGSLIFYAGLCQAMGKGRIIGIDIEIRPHNRTAIEAHMLFDRIDLLEGSSTAPDILEETRRRIRPGEVVLVILDSDHSYQHVRDELEAYAPTVSVNSYIVATDGIMRDLTNVPRGNKRWEQSNPAMAAEDFARENPHFLIEQPVWRFNESTLSKNVTHWPSAYLRRIR